MAWQSIVTAQIVPLDDRHPQLFKPLSTWDTQRILHYLNQQTITMKGKPPGWSRVFLGRSDLRDKRFPHAKQRQPACV
jgi:hypothetical protein